MERELGLVPHHSACDITPCSPCTLGDLMGTWKCMRKNFRLGNLTAWASAKAMAELATALVSEMAEGVLVLEVTEALEVMAMEVLEVTATEAVLAGRGGSCLRTIPGNTWVHRPAC